MEPLVAIVSGANRGIGFEVVRQLAHLGYTVFLGSRELHKGIAAVEELGFNKDQIIPLELDVTLDVSVAMALLEVKQRFNHVDVIINNAAIHYDDWEQVTNVDMKIVLEAMNTNTYGAIRLTNAFLPLIKNSKRGRIVNVSSGAGSLSTMSPNTPAYNLSKVSMNALTRMYAAELKPHDILVNSICPGWTFTDLGKGGRPVPEGAASVVWGVTIHDDGPTGGFFRDGKPIDW